jgi:hypothetical protein
MLPRVKEVARIEILLADEEDKNEKPKVKMRLLKRGSGHESRTRYEEKAIEVELLRQRNIEREEINRLVETRVAEKNRTILYLQNYLRT